MDYEKQALDILREFATTEPYIIGHSGGKDSDVIHFLAKKAAVPHMAVHNLTTVDAPETVRYIKSKKDVKIEYPKLSMWQLIIKNKMPPTRLVRYCCAELKEYYGKGKKIVTGVRKAESKNREKNQGIVTFTNPKKNLKNEIEGNVDFHSTDKGGVVVYNIDNTETRRVVESCYRTNKTLINPIINWEDDFLWWYIKKNDIEINTLYKEGFCRVGCIGCPMAGKGRYKEFARYPKYQEQYIRTFGKMLEHRKEVGLENKMGWETGLDVFNWWMEDKNIKGQLSFAEGEDLELKW